MPRFYPITSPHGLSLVLAVLLVACDDVPSRVSVIDPVFVEACRFSDCSGNGQCSAQADGSPVCLCEVGYGGAQCDGCDGGFHRDSKQRCAPDRRCAEQATNPCGLYGSCDDQQGVIACHCDPGYEGPRCNLCAKGYGRDAYGECLQLVISDGNLSDGGVTTPGKPGKCAANACSGHGDCDDASGQAVCQCSPGYALPDCGSCTAGFHAENGKVCKGDQECLPSTCSGQGTCVMLGNAISCACNEGYAGARCESCEAGYHRDGTGACVNDPVCTSNAVGTPTRLDFESFTTFPEFENNCISGVMLDTARLALTSIAADGDVWACAANTVYGLSTKHVFLEAGTLGPAQLIFGGPVSQLSFDYGARSALALEVLADGKAVATLTAARRTHGSQMFTFDPPVKLVELRSLNQNTHQIGIDNIVYTLSTCP